MALEPNTSSEISSNPVDAIANLLSEGSQEQEEPTQEAEPEQSEDTIEDDAQVEAEDQSEQEPSEGEEYSLADVAEVLGLEENDVGVDDDGNLTFKTKIDGKESTVSLAELRKGYQMESAITQRGQKQAEERKAFEAQRAQVQEQVTNQLQQTEGMMMMMQQELLKDYQSVNWEELRNIDPAEYTAKRYDFEQRQGQLQQAGGYVQQMRDQYAQEQEAKKQELVQQEWGRMMENNPDWNKPEVYDKEMRELRDFASTRYGFTDEDFKSVTDSRTIELIKDAKAYNQGKKVVEEKKVKRPVPKVQRAKDGRFVSKKRASKLDKLVKAAKTARGSNKRDLQTEAVTELLMGGSK